jgi:nitroreductase
MSDFWATAKARKSVRGYFPTPLEKEKLQQIAEATFEAPNFGPVFVSVVTNGDLIKEIDDKALAGMKASGNDFLVSRAAIPGYRPLYGAPAVVIISGPKGVPYSDVNAAAAATSAAYAATALGLGSCYAITPTLALNADADLAARAGVTEGNTSFVGLLVGYEGPEAVPAPARPKAVSISFVE